MAPARVKSLATYASAIASPFQVPLAIVPVAVISVRLPEVITVPLILGSVMVLSETVGSAAVKIVSMSLAVAPSKYKLLPVPLAVKASPVVASPTAVISPMPPEPAELQVNPPEALSKVSTCPSVAVFVTCKSASKIVSSVISELSMAVPKVEAIVIDPEALVMFIPSPSVKAAKVYPEPFPISKVPLAAADPSRPVPPLDTSRYCSLVKVSESLQ